MNMIKMKDGKEETRWFKGLYRTSKYGKWKPFRVGVMNVGLADHELRKRIIFQIKHGSDWDESIEKGKDIVELKYES